MAPHPPTREPTDMRLLALASEHLRLMGAKRLTVVAIAEAAGMTHANVYRYFPSKEALIDAVVDAWIKSVETRLSDIADGPDPSDDKLERMILALARANRDGLSDNPALYAAFRDATVKRRAITRRHRLRVRSLIDRVIEEGVASGAFEPRDRDQAAAFALDICFRFTHPIAVELEADVPQSQFDQRLGAVVRVLLRALASGAI
ncbi:MAG: TetR family transcriptional regulator [Hyphomicrobiales bacterium]|nr:TetR family transcriptional regulator [Hyphomicrobiales bacterium]